MSGQWVWRITLRATDRIHDPQRCSCGRPTTKAAADFDHRMSGVSVSPLELDRALLAAAAHRDGATTNDAVLVTVAAALHQILLSRRESVDPIVITVPVSGRRPGGGRGCNLVSPMLVNSGYWRTG